MLRIAGRRVSAPISKQWRAYSQGGVGRKNQLEHPLLNEVTAKFRTHGHRAADLNPLYVPSVCDFTNQLDELVKELKAHYGEGEEVPTEGFLYEAQDKLSVSAFVDHLQGAYSGKIGLEASHCKPDEAEWLYAQVEQKNEMSTEEKRDLLQQLIRGESFDHFVAKKFVTTKRYGMEGMESLMVGLQSCFASSAANALDHLVISMAHRGRLNCLEGLLNYPAASIFRKIKGESELPKDGNDGLGDVLSHLATTTDVSTKEGKVRVSLLHNPSHLEAANAVAMGKVRSKQDKGQKGVRAVLVHGDAAMIGQGVVAEGMVLSQLEKYRTGGSIHIVANNQIGYTATADRGRSSKYATDIAALGEAPVLHVNGDDPEAVWKAARIAAAFVAKFDRDCFVDVIGYRRRGHNELDEATFTQPLMYAKIGERPTVVTLYGDALVSQGAVQREEIEAWTATCHANLAAAYGEVDKDVPGLTHLDEQWSGVSLPTDLTHPVDTGCDVETLREVGRKSVDTGSVSLHKRLAKGWKEPRLERLSAGSGIDWATAEAMAVGKLLQEGTDVRISGQDVGRGTFSQRHFKVYCQEDNHDYEPLNHLSDDQGRLHIADSPLSEYAVLCYEYGYSIDHPNQLVMWEAQFGDFVNSAQIAVDQFISSGEAKWLRQSGLVVMLPHGYDGAGPEHSSSKLERFLQMCDSSIVDPKFHRNRNPNMQVILPTTPANYFHALCRQMKRPYRKPLIIAGPKTLLRDPMAVSDLSDFKPGTAFQSILGDEDVSPSQVSRVFWCSGKIYYELLAERQKAPEGSLLKDTALVRMEELSPFPYEKAKEEADRYSNVQQHIWIQEEPLNQGAYAYVHPRLQATLSKPVYYIGREPIACSATGTSAHHKLEAERILERFRGE